MVDLYDILGVTRDATSEEIAAAYRKKVKKWHPDVSNHPDSEDRMREINEAAELLLNPLQRKKYDEYLSREEFTIKKTFKKTQRDQEQQKKSEPSSYTEDTESHGFTKIYKKPKKKQSWIFSAKIRYAVGFCAAVFVFVLIIVVMINALNSFNLPLNDKTHTVPQTQTSSTVLSDNYIQILQKGDELFKVGDYEDALSAYDAVISQNPDISLIDVWYKKGITQNLLGRYQDASQSFDQVINFAPEDSLALGQKGTALLGLGKYDDALYYTDRALQKNSNLAWIWTNRGIALMNLGQKKEARTAFDNAGILEPENHDASTSQTLMKMVFG
jgi:tetratricopeptide (TPR) repeat protein